VNDNFSNLESICHHHDFLPVHGILFDLGLASFQIDVAERGFSFQQDAPPGYAGQPAPRYLCADIVNRYGEAELADLLWKYGEELGSRKIARAIVKERPIRTTSQLAGIVERALGGAGARYILLPGPSKRSGLPLTASLIISSRLLVRAVKGLGFRRQIGCDQLPLPRRSNCEAVYAPGG